VEEAAKYPYLEWRKCLFLEKAGACAWGLTVINEEGPSALAEIRPQDVEWHWCIHEPFDDGFVLSPTDAFDLLKAKLPLWTIPALPDEVLSWDETHPMISPGPKKSPVEVKWIYKQDGDSCIGNSYILVADLFGGIQLARITVIHKADDAETNRLHWAAGSAQEYHLGQCFSLNTAVKRIRAAQPSWPVPDLPHWVVKTPPTWEQFVASSLRTLPPDPTHPSGCLSTLTLGLCGEAHEFLVALDGKREHAAKELGDLLWYIIAIASRLGCLPDLKVAGSFEGSRAVAQSAVFAACVVAELVKKQVGHRRPDTRKILFQLTWILSAIPALASYIGVSMEEVMATNIEKLEDRYPGGWKDVVRLFEQGGEEDSAEVSGGGHV